MELSKERKQQIRAEEEAALRAKQDAEQQYREEVRRELEEQQQAELERQFRDSVRAELANAAGPPGEQTADIPPPTPVPPAPAAEVQPPVQAAPPAPAAEVKPPIQAAPPAPVAEVQPPIQTAPPAPPAEAQPPVQIPMSPPAPAPPPPAQIPPTAYRPAGPSSRAPVVLPTRAIAMILILGGLAFAIVGFARGPVLPSMSGDTVLRAEPADELETIGDAPRSSSDDDYSSSSSDYGTTDASSPTPYCSSRAALKDAEVSVEVPTDWAVTSDGYSDTLEIRWNGSGESAYVLLQKADIASGESLDGFATGQMNEFMSAATPDQKIITENDDVITDFHGVTAFSIDVVASGTYPFRQRNIYWVKDGEGYTMTCYAAGDTFDDRASDFDRMRESVRL